MRIFSILMQYSYNHRLNRNGSRKVRLSKEEHSSVVQPGRLMALAEGMMYQPSQKQDSRMVSDVSYWIQMN